MNNALVILGSVVTFWLIGTQQPLFASGYDVCLVEATVLCNRGSVDEEIQAAIALRFRVSGKPRCRGHGIKTFETGEVIDAEVQLDEEMDASAIERGSTVTLRYEYHEGLTPEGFQSGESWSLIPLEVPGAEESQLPGIR